MARYAILKKRKVDVRPRPWPPVQSEVYTALNSANMDRDVGRWDIVTCLFSFVGDQRSLCLSARECT